MSNANPRSEQGFSLVETVAAMGVLALAAIPLLQISSDATRNAASLEARVLARTVAENVMAQSMVDPEPIDAGIETGEQTQLGRPYVWTRTGGLGRPGDLQNLEVQVRREGDEQVLARLVALKFIPTSLPLYEVAPTTESGEGEQ